MKTGLIAAVSAVVLGAWVWSRAEPAAKSSAALAEYEARKAQHLKALNTLAAERDEKIAALRKEYMAVLDKLQTENAARGNLDGALAAKTERERILLQKPTTADDKKAMPTWLQAERTKYELDLQQVPVEYQESAGGLLKKYGAELDDLQKKFTAQGDLDAAMAVKSERDRIAVPGAMEPVRVEQPSQPVGIGVPFKLKIVARIDGSDEVRITRTEATWVHKHWGWPESPVMINDREWRIDQNPVLKNSGETRFLPDGLDFKNARLTKTRGRDTAALETSADRLVVYLADSPNGSDLYEVVIEFGK